MPPLLSASHARPHGDAWEAATVNLGIAWLKLGQYEDARDTWTTATGEMDTGLRRAAACMGLGSLALRSGDLEAAHQHFDDAYRQYRLLPADDALIARVLNNLLVVAVRRGNLEDALPEFAEAPR